MAVLARSIRQEAEALRCACTVTHHRRCEATLSRLGLSITIVGVPSGHAALEGWRIQVHAQLHGRQLSPAVVREPTTAAAVRELVRVVRAWLQQAGVPRDQLPTLAQSSPQPHDPEAAIAAELQAAAAAMASRLTQAAGTADPAQMMSILEERIDGEDVDLVADGVRRLMHPPHVPLDGDVAERIADALHIDAIWLLAGTGTPPQPTP
jgi:hypothetical protein